MSFRIKSLSKILEFILFYLLQTAQLKFCHSELNMAVHPLYYVWFKWQCKLHVPIHVFTWVINIIQCRIKKNKKACLAVIKLLSTIFVLHNQSANQNIVYNISNYQCSDWLIIKYKYETRTWKFYDHQVKSI